MSAGKWKSPSIFAASRADPGGRIYGKTLDSRQQQIGNGVTQAIGRYVKEAVLKALDRNMLAEKDNIYRPCQA